MNRLLLKRPIIATKHVITQHMHHYQGSLITAQQQQHNRIHTLRNNSALPPKINSPLQSSSPSNALFEAMNRHQQHHQHYSTARNNKSSVINFDQKNNNKHKNNKEKQDDSSFLKKLGSLLVATVALPFKIVFSLLGVLALHIFFKRMHKKLFGNIQRALFGQMDLLDEAQASLRKKLETTVRLSQNNKNLKQNQQANIANFDDYVLLRAFEVVQRHPLVHDAVSKQLGRVSKEINPGPEAGSGEGEKKKSSFASVFSDFKNKFKSSSTDENDDESIGRVKHFVVLTNAEENMSERDKTILPNGELVYKTTAVFMAVGDNESQNSLKEILKYKQELNKVKKEFPYLEEAELQSKMSQFPVAQGVDLFFPFIVNVVARKKHPNEPYKIERLEVNSQTNDETFLSLDQFIDEVYDQEQEQPSEAFSEDEESSSRFRTRQIIDAEVVEK